MQQATIQPGSQALLPFTVRPAKEPEHRDLYDALTAYAASVTNVADTEALGVDASEAIRQRESNREYLLRHHIPEASIQRILDAASYSSMQDGGAAYEYVLHQTLLAITEALDEAALRSPFLALHVGHEISREVGQRILALKEDTVWQYLVSEGPDCRWFCQSTDFPQAVSMTLTPVDYRQFAPMEAFPHTSSAYLAYRMEFPKSQTYARTMEQSGISEEAYQKERSARRTVDAAYAAYLSQWVWQRPSEAMAERSPGFFLDIPPDKQDESFSLLLSFSQSCGKRRHAYGP